MKKLLGTIFIFILLIGCASKYKEAIQKIEEKETEAYSERAIIEDEEASIE